MPTFDEVFAKLTAKMSAAMEVIAADPDLAARVRDAIEGAEAQAVENAEVQADEARANAIAALITSAGATLATVEAPEQETPDAILWGD